MQPWFPPTQTLHNKNIIIRMSTWSDCQKYILMIDFYISSMPYLFAAGFTIPNICGNLFTIPSCYTICFTHILFHELFNGVYHILLALWCLALVHIIVSSKGTVYCKESTAGWFICGKVIHCSKLNECIWVWQSSKDFVIDVNDMMSYLSSQKCSDRLPFRRSAHYQHIQHSD